MSISLIACVSKNYALGNKQDLIFNIKEDLQRFQKLTSGGNIVIMGMKTFDSIIEMNGKPLSDRVNVVLTRNKKYKQRFNEFVFHDIDSILKGIKTMGENDKQVFVIGGGEVYSLMLPYCNEVLLTVVDQHVDKADTFYPMELQESLGFIKTDGESYYSDKYNCSYAFTRYIKPTTTNEEE